jgi:ATP-binding cassette subfamily C protein CydD
VSIIAADTGASGAGAGAAEPVSAGAVEAGASPAKAEPDRELLTQLVPDTGRLLPALWTVVLVNRLALFAWYFVLAAALDAWLFTSSPTQMWLPAALILALLLPSAWLRQSLRDRAAERVGRFFFARMLEQLQRHRRALIRRKPMSAWQDFHSRHLPALESYFIDYRLQRWLVATLPLLVLVLIFPVSWLAGITLLLTMPLIPLFMWLVGRGAAALQQRHIVALDRLGAFFGDRILGRQTVRLHDAAQRELQRFDDASRSLNERLAAVLRVAFLSTTVLDFFSTVSIALVAVFTGFALLGEIPIGFYGEAPTLTEALFILLVAPAFFAELKTLGHLYHSRSGALGAAAAWQSVLAAPPDPAMPPAEAEGWRDIALRDVSILAFDGSELLRVEGLALKPGERVLLRGPSGSGKSVLLEGLAGLRALRGSVTLDGRAVVDLSALRDRVFLLEQTPALFPGTVAANLGLEQHDDAAIEAALARVGLGAWCEQLPEGLHTRLDDSPALSGGQRQRFAAARLLLFRPSLVFLDEPTAHLSDDERAEVAALLQALLADSAVVWASHDTPDSSWFTQRWFIDGAAAPRSLRT